MVSGLRFLLLACTRSAFPAFVVVPLLALPVAFLEVIRQQWIPQALSSLALVHVVLFTAHSAFLAAAVLVGLFALWFATSPRTIEVAPRVLAAVAAWGLFLVPLQRTLQPRFGLMLLENDHSPFVVKVLLAMPMSLAASSALMGVAGLLLFRWRSARSRSVPDLVARMLRPRPWALLAGGVLATAVLVVDVVRPEPPVGATNMVVIVIDTLRADHMGVYGYGAHPTSPRMDAFAADTVVYEDAVSTAPWTTPAVAAMFTSRYPRRHGFQMVPLRLAPGETTFAEVLRSIGYRTHAVVANICASSAVGLDAGFEVMDESQLADHRDISSAGVTDRALGWLEGHGHEPFLLYVHYLDPHFAYIMHAENDFAAAYNGKFRAPLSHGQFTAGTRSMTQADLDFAIASYDSEIAHTDAQVGRLLDGLRKLGLYDGSMIVFTSDHGEAFDDRGDRFIGHGPTVQQELLHVPLLVKHPGGERAGSRVHGLVSTMDIAPTLLQAAGFRFPATIEIDGMPLGEAGPDRIVIAETRRDTQRRAVYRGRWKLLVDVDKGSQSLIDLDNDPGERTDVSAQHAEVARELADALASWETALGNPLGSAAAFSDAQKERLEGLGYAQ